MSTPAAAEAWALLDGVRDPEIPAVSITDLGIVRDIDVSADGTSVVAAITPTYSGCPAMHAIEQAVGETLRTRFERVEVQTVLAPAWSTEWISERGRERLRSAGIAPPAGTRPVSAAARMRSTFAVFDDGAAAEPTPDCPRCDSSDVARISEFGSTACKSLWRCRSCGDPFDMVKAL